jgi:hypothetical protein
MGRRNFCSSPVCRGTRFRLTVDFLIGAHAVVRANRLAIKDDGSFREQFRTLVVVEPTAG